MAKAIKISRTKKLFFLGVLTAVAVALPLTIYLTQQQQNIQSKAEASTTLSFTPASSSTTPLSHAVNDQIPLTISLTPGSNLISIVSLEITYDVSKLEPSGTVAFTPNTAVFPRILEGPVYTPGRIQVSLSIGPDPAQAISSPTTIGTVTFKAINPTDSSPLVVRFGDNTKAFSIAGTDQPSEDVLSSASPAYMIITSPNQVISPSLSPATHPPLSPSPSLTVSNTSAPTQTSLQLSVLLDGIGSSRFAGIPATLSPLHQARTFQLDILGNNNTKIAELPATLSYKLASRDFQGTVTLPSSLPTGTYSVTLKTDGFLSKQLAQNITIKQGSTTPLPSATLVNGDLDNDGSLTVLDYGTLIDCWGGATPSLPMSNPSSVYNSADCKAHAGRATADMNDDGIIDQNDFNLYLKEMTTQYAL